MKAVLAFPLVAMATSAQAQLVKIAWDADGRFEQRMVVAPAKFAELCGALSKSEKIAWTFKSDQTMDFNIHYHQGQRVVTPAQQKGVAAAQGTLKVALDHDYCWMWTNKSGTTAELSVSLTRSR